MTTYIYILRHPKTDEIRYVGLTTSPTARLYRHQSTQDDTRNARWVRSLVDEDLSPVMEIICEADSYERAELLEILVIDAFRSLGVQLNNDSDGGGGCTGYQLTEEQRDRIRAAAACNPNKHLSTETRAKLSEALSGKTRSNETRAQQSESMRKQYASRDPQEEAERLTKVGAALRGRTHTAAAREAMRSAHAARRAAGLGQLTEDGRERLREAGKKAGEASKRRAAERRARGELFEDRSHYRYGPPKEKA